MVESIIFIQQEIAEPGEMGRDKIASLGIGFFDDRLRQVDVREQGFLDGRIRPHVDVFNPIGTTEDAERILLNERPRLPPPNCHQDAPNRSEDDAEHVIIN